MLFWGFMDNLFVYEWCGLDVVLYNWWSCGSVGVSFFDGQENVGFGINVFGIKECESVILIDKFFVVVWLVIEQVLDEVEMVVSGYVGGLNDVVIVEQFIEIVEYFIEEFMNKVSDVYINEVDVDLCELMDFMDEKGWFYVGVWYI